MGERKQPTSLVCDGLKMCCLDKQCGSPIIAVIVLLMHINKVTKTALQRQCVRLFGYHYKKSFTPEYFFSDVRAKEQLTSSGQNKKLKKTFRDINTEIEIINHRISNQFRFKWVQGSHEACHVCKTTQISSIESKCFEHDLVHRKCEDHSRNYM